MMLPTDRLSFPLHTDLTRHLTVEISIHVNRFKPL